MKHIVIIILMILLIPGCGSKKFTSQIDKEQKIDISLIDSSTIVKTIEHEKQFVDTHTRERIVTYYGVKLVPHLVNGDTIFIPVSYPERKEEERDIQEQSEIWKTRVRDSIRNAIDLKYRSDLKEKDKRVLELKESTIIWQIATLIGAIVALLLLVLFSRHKK